MIHYVIAGGGIAGVTAAKKLRKLDPEGAVTLVNGEPVLPYSRPMLSKAPLRGFQPEALAIQSENWYRENRIDLLTGISAQRLDVSGKTLALSDGTVLPYDKCILATGAESFVPPIPGASLPGVFVVRRLSDVRAIRAARLTARTAVVIGGGVIGLETAWELRKSGLSVTVLELAGHLMERLLDGESSELLKKLCEAQGIPVETGVKIQEIADHPREVKLADGGSFPGDLVILSCGIRANVGLAKEAGITVGRGIAVDAHMQTSAPDVYACGDCAEFEGINLAIWNQATAQSIIAARNASGSPAVYVPVRSDLVFQGLGSAMYLSGDAGKNPDRVYRIRTRNNHHRHAGTFAVNRRMELDFSRERYVFADGILVGAVLMGDLRAMPDVKEAMKNRESMDSFCTRMGLA